MTKPIVDGLEAEFAGQAAVLRLDRLSDVGRALAGRYGVRSLPGMLVFDGAGALIWQGDGLPDGGTIGEVVRALLAAP